MEIPYAVHPRRDTGLYNAKVGIWLFLASEVMLFGALFSSYILLRVGADAGEWPTHLLNVPIGTVNTLVLISSSVTVVLGWAALKVGNFARYRFCQTITVLCALAFVGIKSYEYHDKFTHYQVVTKEGKVFDGHLMSQSKEAVVLHGHEIDISKGVAAGVREANRHHDHGKEIEIKSDDIKKIGNYGPSHNTYMSIYFTLTGLHALHVIGGALVIGFILWPGASMWKTDPERYINRVEVSGLFWHFVDLVWIFLFPVLYLL
jgi:cytochrome c oxidase subunit 3